MTEYWIKYTDSQWELWREFDSKAKDNTIKRKTQVIGYFGTFLQALSRLHEQLCGEEIQDVDAATFAEAVEKASRLYEKIMNLKEGDRVAV